jgi:hypothetical protein
MLAPDTTARVLKSFSGTVQVSACSSHVFLSHRLRLNGRDNWHQRQNLSGEISVKFWTINLVLLRYKFSNIRVLLHYLLNSNRIHLLRYKYKRYTTLHTLRHVSAHSHHHLRDDSTRAEHVAERLIWNNKLYMYIYVAWQLYFVRI